MKLAALTLYFSLNLAVMGSSEDNLAGNDRYSDIISAVRSFYYHPQINYYNPGISSYYPTDYPNTDIIKAENLKLISHDGRPFLTLPVYQPFDSMNFNGMTTNDQEDLKKLDILKENYAGNQENYLFIDSSMSLYPQRSLVSSFISFLGSLPAVSLTTIAFSLPSIPIPYISWG